jgi:hypothetical protein
MAKEVMEDGEFRKHVECLMSMATGFLMGNSDRKTFENNLKLIAHKMVPNVCYCDLCVQRSEGVPKKDCQCEVCAGFEKKDG